MKPLITLLAAALMVVTGFSATRWEEMDYGPFFSSSVTMQSAKNGEDVAGIVTKGITFPLKREGKVIGACCFDTMLCRWAGGWLSPAGNQPPLRLKKI